MKIGFIGSGGTGKSTTAKALSEATGLPIMISPSRACFEKRGIKTQDDQDKQSPEGRLLLQLDIFEAITKQCQENSEGIFERTNADNLFYALFHCHDILQKNEVLQMYGVTEEILTTYDLIVFFPLFGAWENTGDGMRTERFAPRVIMDRFLSTFRRNTKRHIVLYDESVEKRVHHIKENMR